MKEIIKNWIEKAESDLDAAKYNFKGKRYDISAFLCQQAAEKALKALSLKKIKKLRKIHDLIELGKDVNISEDLLEKLKELTLAYIYSRYPDVKQELNLKEKVSKFIKTSEEVIQWVKKLL
ncbi:MAG: HEPN domain-containing protein [Nanoarchaeota archaeon]|nr:HEPN domain-containing protein [Nanoarchaeota archaeon]